MQTDERPCGVLWDLCPGLDLGAGSAALGGGGSLFARLRLTARKQQLASPERLAVWRSVC